MRRALVGIAAAATVGAGLLASPVAAGAAPNAASTRGESTDYVVLYAQGTSSASARAAIERSGGTVVQENTKVGYAFVRSTDSAFRDRVAKEATLEGAARNRSIGTAPKSERPKREAIEKVARDRATTPTRKSAAISPTSGDPLSDRQWDMRQIGATKGGSYRVQPGDRRVLVGVIDTGVDATHPDIAAHFNRSLSRNFTTDIPSIDGPCEFASCKDPAGWDDNGHGTHVASTIGAPINRIGIAGVAPNVTLVNVRAGQDFGYFFLQSTLDALTYAGDIGVDVVNMSFYTDPWLFNCVDNPADSPAEQREQRTIRLATQRAMDYAVNHGVTPVAAAGNEATNLDHPTFDPTSPDFPPGTAKDRDITNKCITVPTETRGVIAVSSTGLTARKAYYSNFGTEQTDVAGPGGDYYDTPDNTGDVRNLVLAAYPKRLARINGDIDASGQPTTPFVVRNCRGTGSSKVCGYWQYLQGTSMASPHAAGVVALIVSQFGHADAAHAGGLTLAPSAATRILRDSAVEHACPQPRDFHYKRIASDGTVYRAHAYCGGPDSDNGFYGSGIVNAYSAVRSNG